jgi:hypothetical protein
MPRRLVCHFACALILGSLAHRAGAHDFSVTPDSLEVIQLRYEGRDIIDQNGGGPVIFGSALGLGSDELDCFSYGKDILVPAGPNFFVSLQFSVSRETVGSGSVITAQRNGNGAAGDKFALLILRRSGRVIGPFLASEAPGHNLTPKPQQESNIDGLSFPAGTTNGIFYTVPRGGVKAPSDIYYVESPGVPPVLYATAAQLGLQTGDNIDGLAIKDGGTIGVLDAADIVYVSLDTASPTRVGGADNILQVWPGPIAVAIPFNQLGITSAGTEEIDAITAYDPGREGGGGSLGVTPGASAPLLIDLSSLDASTALVFWMLGNVMQVANFTARLNPSGQSLISLLAGRRWISLHENKGRPDTRVTGDFDTLTMAEQLVLQEAAAVAAAQSAADEAAVASYEGTPFARSGDPIPGTSDSIRQFFYCGGGLVGPWQCGFSTTIAAAPSTNSHWMAWCDNSTGTFAQITRLLSPGATVSGVNGTIAALSAFDYAPDAGNPAQGNLYGIARTNTAEIVMLRIPVASTPSGPSFGAPTALMNSLTPVPGGAAGERFIDYAFRPAAGSVAFRGVSSLGQDGVYVNDGNGVIRKVADKTTPVPGLNGNFTSFTDTLSNDDGAVTFIASSSVGRGVFTNATGRLMRIAGAGDVLDGRSVTDVYMQRDVVASGIVGFGARFADGNSGLFLKSLPLPFDTGNGVRRGIHVDVELDPDPAILGPDPRALLVGDIGPARLRGVWSSNGAVGTILIPASEVARLLSLQFGIHAPTALGDWSIKVDVATGAILSSTAAGTLANGPFAFSADTDGGPWTSPLIAGGIPGTQAGFETNPSGQKLFCSNAFSQIAGSACGTVAFGFVPPARYDRQNGFVHMTGPLTLGNAVLWGFLGDQRWLEAPPGACPDLDSDGLCDAADRCPFYLSTNADTDNDGRGNLCECTDQNGDGRNTVTDLVAINTAIFNPALVTALCDGNNDGACNVADIVSANIEIFSPTSTSTCGRQPIAGP